MLDTGFNKDDEITEALNALYGEGEVFSELDISLEILQIMSLEEKEW